MSEETVMSPITPVEGSLPPKVAPFGASVKEESSPAAAPVAAPAADTPAVEAPTSGTKTIKLRPVIRKPVIRKPPAPGAAATAPKLPGADVPAAPATPVEPATAEATPAPASNPKSITGAIPAPAVLKKTGIIAEGILTPSQAQAAKTKTSRISLESAMGVPPPATGSSPLKTIKLRRPTGIKSPSSPISPIKPVSPVVPPSAPEESMSPVSAEESSPAPIAPIAPVTEAATEAADSSEKKTVKLRRPTAAIKRPTISTAVAPAEGDNLDEIKDIPDLAPIGDFPAEAPQKSSPLAVITLVASIAAIAVLGVVTYQLFSQCIGPVTGPNEFAFIQE